MICQWIMANASECVKLGRAEIPPLRRMKVDAGEWRQCAPARKAHPAVLVRDIDELRDRLTAADLSPIDDDSLPDHRRFYVADPFGNRLEFLEKSPGRPAAIRPSKSTSRPRFTERQGQYLAFIDAYIR